MSHKTSENGPTAVSRCPERIPNRGQHMDTPELLGKERFLLNF